MYLGKSAVGIAVFYLAYLMLFQKSKNFIFNRIYLIGSFTLSLIIPLIIIPVYTESFQIPAYLMTNPASVEISVANPTYFEINRYLIICLIFLAGFTGFLVKLIIGNIRAVLLIRKGTQNISGNIKFTVSNEDIHPFSFFNTIVIPAENLKSTHFETILSHEYIHVKEKHTIDVIIAEILFLFQWFNPFAWLLKDAIKANLEFLTDDKIIQHTDRKTYQMAMVALADKNGIAPFLTALNGSQLKNRIIMMKSNQKNKSHIIKKLLLLPLLTMLLFALSNKEYRVSAQDAGSLKISGKVTSAETGEALPAATVIITGTTTGLITDEKGEYTINIADNNNELSFYKDGYKSTTIPIQGRNTINLSLETSNSSSAKLGEGYGTIEVTGYGRLTTGNIQNHGAPSLTGNTPLYVVDGQIQESLDNLDPNTIESVQILKDENAIELYGDEAKNGVVIITTKK